MFSEHDLRSMWASDICHLSRRIVGESSRRMWERSMLSTILDASPKRMYPLRNVLRWLSGEDESGCEQR